MKQLLLFFALGIFFLSSCITSQPRPETAGLLSVHSKDVGWLDSGVDVIIHEIQRRERTSLLELTNFTHNSSTERKFLFCFVSDLAKKRHFRYAFWSKPGSENNTILVVFPQSEDVSIESIIGDQFHNYSFYDHAMDTEEWEWAKLQSGCGF